MYVLCMGSKTINITLPLELVEKIDKAAKSEFSSRSDFIRESLVRRLKHQRIVDEWGDEGEWETIVNFQEIDSEGVPAEDVLKALEKLTS
jgi:Arc/MetJ-type ribon-helix-helix transcriptional regulator